MRENIKNIYFVDRFPLTKEFCHRFEFSQLEEQKYNVKFIDISHLLKRQKLESTLSKGRMSYSIPLQSKTDFKDFIAKHKDDSIFVSTVPFIASSAWMYNAFFNRKVNYILVSFSSFPEIKGLQSRASQKAEKIYRFFKRLSLGKVIKKPLETYTYINAKQNIHPAKMMIKSKHNNKIKNEVLIDKNTIKRYSFSTDFKAYDKIKDNPPLIKEDYAVFIDQYFYHHPDFKTNHIIHSFDDEDYYPVINRFLKEYQEKTGLKVIIASHPRRNKEQQKDFCESFDLYFNETAHLIKDAKMVFMHFSTAISFAVICKKPFVLLNAEFFKGTVYNKIKSFAHFFNKTMIYIDQPFKSSIEEASFINPERYQDYQDLFLMHPDAKHETFSEKICNFINNHM